MDGKKNIAAIVAAYNEAGRIHRVLAALTKYQGFDEIIVVDDGSTDGTAAVAAMYPVRVIRLPQNLGKGHAMAVGVAATDADILFFCDADMYGITSVMLESIVSPVAEGKSEMVIAMRNWRMYYVGFLLSVIPILGGQRALTRELWEKVPHDYKERFMIETALNFYARYWGNGFSYIVVPGLKQMIKEHKLGLWRGFTARVRMSIEVIVTQIRLQLFEIPLTLKAGRVALRNTAAALMGTILGVMLLIASYRGPVVFVRELFAKELREDPDAPFVHLLLYVGSSVGSDILASAGVIIVALNILVVLASAANVRYLAYGPSPAQRVR